MSDPKNARRAELASLLPRLRRFARTLTRDRDDADDVVQVALEKALPKLGELPADARLDAWMFRIVRNAWIDEARSRQRWGAVLAPEEAGEKVASVESPLEGMAVEEALARLPEEQRVAVVLVLAEGLSYAEAAALLEVPVGTLTSRLARGRIALQKLLDGEKP